MAETQKSVATYALDGTRLDFPIPFEYLARKFIVVTLLGTDTTPSRVLNLTDEYRFTSPNQITLSSLWGPGNGYSLLEIRRYTSATERLVNFSDGSILRAYDLNTSQIQSLHIAEEARDVSSQALIRDMTSWNANGLRIRNLANPVNPQDAATKKYVDDSSDVDVAFTMEQILRTLRAPQGESIGQLPGASLRAGKSLGFDSLGNPSVLTPGTGSAEELALDLASYLGATKVGWLRGQLTDLDKSIAGQLNAQQHNLWEWREFVTSKPNLNNPSTWDWTTAIQLATDHISMIGGGTLYAKGGEYRHTGINLKPYVSYLGDGIAVTKYINTGTGHAFKWLGDTNSRLPSFTMGNLSIRGNTNSLDGLHVEWLQRRATAVVLLTSVEISDNGQDGMYFEAADAVSLVGCHLTRNKRDGYSAFSGTNQTNVFGGSISGNGRDGYFINQIASTCVLYGVAIHDNAGSGVRALRAEEPMIMNCAFNRNLSSAVSFLGGTDDLKDVEAAIIFGCLFGDNANTGACIVLNRVTTGAVQNNYFYNVSETKPYHIRLATRTDGIIISGNRRKSIAVNQPPLVSDDGNINVRYTHEDTGAVGPIYNTKYKGVIHQYLMATVTSIVFQTRVNEGSSSPNFILDASGKLSWGTGDLPPDVNLSRSVAGSLDCSGGFRTDTLMLAERTAPSAQVGKGRLFFDVSTQSLKMVLPSGVIRTFTVT